MVVWDRRRYLFVPRPCRKKSPSRALYGFVPQVSNDGAKVRRIFHTSKYNHKYFPTFFNLGENGT